MDRYGRRKFGKLAPESISADLEYLLVLLQVVTRVTCGREESLISLCHGVSTTVDMCLLWHVRQNLFDPCPSLVLCTPTTFEMQGDLNSQEIGRAHV